MQTKLLAIFIGVLWIAGCIHKSGLEYRPEGYLDSTREMTRKGEYSKALDRYLWFHNHILEKDTGIRGVRLSFALSYWKELADVYPPAMSALKDDRDKKVQQIISEGKSRDFFADVVAINRTLGEPNKSIALFETVSHKYPVFANETVRYVLDDLLAAKKYDLIQKNVVSLMEQYERIQGNYIRSFEEIGDSDKSLKSFMEEKFVGKVLELLKYCDAIQDTNTPKKIQEKAFLVVKDSRILKASPN